MQKWRESTPQMFSPVPLDGASCGGGRLVLCRQRQARGPDVRVGRGPLGCAVTNRFHTANVKKNNKCHFLILFGFTSTSQPEFVTLQLTKFEEIWLKSLPWPQAKDKSWIFVRDKTQGDIVDSQVVLIFSRCFIFQLKSHFCCCGGRINRCNALLEQHPDTQNRSERTTALSESPIFPPSIHVKNHLESRSTNTRC